LRIELQDIKDYSAQLGEVLEQRPSDYLPLVSHIVPTVSRKTPSNPP
jgi:hypothetical protein